MYTYLYIDCQIARLILIDGVVVMFLGASNVRSAHGLVTYLSVKLYLGTHFFFFRNDSLSIFNTCTPFYRLIASSFFVFFLISFSLCTGSVSRRAELECRRLRNPHVTPHYLRLKLEQGRAKV